jgi:hypothetical protein
MPSRFALTLYEVSTWIIPLIVAITFTRRRTVLSHICLGTQRPGVRAG